MGRQLVDFKPGFHQSKDTSCLSDSDTSNEDHRPTPGDESSSEEDSDSSHDAPASTSATTRQSAATSTTTARSLLEDGKK